MADSDLEAIRARRMAELQAQYGEVRTPSSITKLLQLIFSI